MFFIWWLDYHAKNYNVYIDDQLFWSDNGNPFIPYYMSAM